MISIHIVSDPPGADVLVAGAKIGTTPLDKKLHRGSKMSELTIHLDGYTDAVEHIDLGGDYSNDHVKLVKVQAEAHEHDAHETHETHDTHETHTDKHVDKTATHSHATTTTHKAEVPHVEHKKPLCQPPGQIDPFDTRCDGHACPVCK
jgi:hypothetical protein